MALLIPLIAIFLSELGSAPQLMAMAIAVRYNRILPVLAGGLVACLLNAMLSATLGGSVYPVLPPAARSLFLGVAYLYAAGALLLWRRRIKLPNVQRYGLGFASFIAIGALQLGDKTQFLIGAHSAATGAPLLAALVGFTGMALALGLGLFLREDLAEIFPLNLIRKLVAGIFAIAGIMLAARGIFGF